MTRDVPTPFYRSCQGILRATVPWMIRPRYRGMYHVPVAGAALLLSNHQSYLDPILLGMHLARPCHFLARDTLFRNRVFGRLIRKVNTFPVRRDTADVTALTDVRLLRFTQRNLRRLRRRYPRTGAQIYVNLSKVLADRLASATERAR